MNDAELPEKQAMPEVLSPAAPHRRSAAASGPRLDEFRYAVKWVDASDGSETPHEKRDLTLKQAQREAGWLARHNRRFYPGELVDRSPFAGLRVWLQCSCGRDVIDLREPHTVPAVDRVCPNSGAGVDRGQEVTLAAR